MTTVSSSHGSSAHIVKSKSTDELVPHQHPPEHRSTGSGDFTHMVQKLQADKVKDLQDRMQTLQEQNEASNKQVTELTAKLNTLEEELRVVQTAEQAKLRAHRTSCC